MIEIQLRIAELNNRLAEMEKRPKRTGQWNHSEEFSSIEGEIKGLRWVLSHCFNQSEPNLIEQ